MYNKNKKQIQKENPAKSLQRQYILAAAKKTRKKSNLPVPSNPTKQIWKNFVFHEQQQQQKEPPNQTTNDKIKRLIALEIFRTLPEKKKCF